MRSELPLITTIAAALAVALPLGFLAVRMHLPPLVGYLLGGVLIGPFTPGFVADSNIAGELADIGVMLLMFGVGLHFSVEDLLKVRKIALPGAVLQVSIATASGAVVALCWGWSWISALVFGLSMSVASTVVLLRGLEDNNALGSINGLIAVGWLVVQDLIMVLVLVLLPPLAGWAGGSASAVGTNLWIVIGLTVLKVSSFVLLMFVVGRRTLPWLFYRIAATGSRELFTLYVVGVAVVIAYAAAQFFGVSFALGAFFGGMILGESEFSQRAAEESLPLREASSVLFFVSVGMLFDPAIVLQSPLRTLILLALILVFSPLAAGALVVAFGYPLATAISLAAGLAQIGEFSFILAGLGTQLQVLPPEGQNLILAGALLSIALNPLILAAAKPLQAALRAHSALARKLAQPLDPLTELPQTTASNYLAGQVVLVGYGRVGRRIADALHGKGVPYVVVEQNREVVERLRVQGQAAVSGDAAQPGVLVQAHIARAVLLVIATPEIVGVRQIVAIARTLNPGIAIVLRTHDEEEAGLIGNAVDKVFFGEAELAKGMSNYVLQRYGQH